MSKNLLSSDQLNMVCSAIDMTRVKIGKERQDFIFWATLSQADPEETRKTLDTFTQTDNQLKEIEKVLRKIFCCQFPSEQKGIGWKLVKLKKK